MRTRIPYKALWLCLLLTISSQQTGYAQQLPPANAERLQGRIDQLAAISSATDGNIDRVAYSADDIAAREYIMQLMRVSSLQVRIDAGGNIHARRSGADNTLPPIVFGSHIDSVPKGGIYDGPAGVLAAIEVINLLNEASIVTRHPLEVIVFSNEEGGLIGSLALTGKLKPAALDVISHSGLSIRDGIVAIGGNPDQIPHDQLQPGDIHAFVELHIEQGAVLQNTATRIGVVEGIVGIGWWDVTVTGVANHAGTTPMDLRNDALLAAAELTLAINQAATSMPGGQVATVGRIAAQPGAPNVIPGRVDMSLEIRDLDQTVIDTLFNRVQQQAVRISKTNGITISFKPIDVASPPAPTDPRMRDIIAAAAEQHGLRYRLMPSGAGHDAQDMVYIAPTGMIFVPSRDGISHSPDEFTAAQDIADGADVLLSTVLSIDAGALEK